VAAARANDDAFFDSDTKATKSAPFGTSTRPPDRLRFSFPAGPFHVLLRFPMSHHRPSLHDRILTRRDFLHRCGMGMGALAFSSLLGQAGFFGGNAQAGVSDLNPLAPKAPPLPGKAKRVIHLFMNGGPSQVDTFDPKPALAKYDGQPLPGPNLATERKTGAALASPFAFKKYGQSGIEVSDLFAKTAESIDDMCVIRSMYADVPNHEPSLMLMNCGELGVVGLVRAREREPKHAGFHQHVPARLPHPGDAKLAVGLFAGRLPGDLH
jgi:hypothetical protein